MADKPTSPGVDAAESQDKKAPKEKRFLCTTCQRTFARLEHLQRHERTHTNEKPFLCRQCDHRFSRRYEYTLATWAASTIERKTPRRLHIPTSLFENATTIAYARGALVLGFQDDDSMRRDYTTPIDEIW
ncbi:hypothetical protein BDZ85DRAFT_17995 [Elsinoe ampelina]|uniref:C2H2-type domain-containing protein n=1 Tax=Elsinoe ampelina TaxID=302913 RepID=A0A6A6G744_9PEZI|nr:hypothetical protein BDZ85DRAFT_17995 [Elsinoe ampelina]